MVKTGMNMSKALVTLAHTKINLCALFMFMISIIVFEKIMKRGNVMICRLARPYYVYHVTAINQP